MQATFLAHAGPRHVRHLFDEKRFAIRSHSERGTLIHSGRAS